jgi:nicotinamidase-related amidase
LRRRGIKTIVLGGIATNLGVESAARSAWKQGYDVVFAADAMTSLATDLHEFALERSCPGSGSFQPAQRLPSSMVETLNIRGNKSGE